ncbi:MAG: lysostaphin resistance A-like protein [Bacteroidia bacterium]
MTPIKVENKPLSHAEKILQPLIIFTATLTLAYGFQMASQFITYKIWGTSLVNIEDFTAMTNAELWSFRISQIFYQFGAFLVAPLFFTLLIKVNPIAYWGLNRVATKQKVIYVFVILLLSLFSSSFLYDVLDFINWPAEIIDAEALNQSMMQQLLPAENFGVVILNIFMFVILPAVLEEIFFRGTVQRMLTNITQNPHVAVIITAFVFALVHGNISGILAYFSMGLLLGYLFYITGNLKYSILFHLLNNGISLLLDWMYRNGSLSFDPINAKVHWVPGVLATIALIVIMQRLYKNGVKPKLKLASDRSPKVVWVKIFEGHDAIQVQMYCDALNAEGYNATILNKKDSNYGYGYVELHVPMHQEESAKAFIEKINI